MLETDGPSSQIEEALGATGAVKPAMSIEPPPGVDYLEEEDEDLKFESLDEQIERQLMELRAGLGPPPAEQPPAPPLTMNPEIRELMQILEEQLPSQPSLVRELLQTLDKYKKGKEGSRPLDDMSKRKERPSGPPPPRPREVEGEEQAEDSADEEVSLFRQVEESAATGGGKGYGQSSVDNSKRLFVGGLLQVTTSLRLKKHFERFGAIDAVVMYDRGTGRSRGFGFLSFESQEAAQAACQDQQIVDGKEVKVVPCWPKEAQGPADAKMFIGGLLESVTAEDLQQHFSKYGEVRCQVMLDKVRHRSRGFAFVNFATKEAMLQALAVPQAIGGVHVCCKVCDPKSESPAYFEAKRLFLGALHLSLTSERLRSFFETFGEVTDAVVLTEKETGRSRGFGYVTFASERIMEVVLAQGSDLEIDGHRIQVRRCTPKASTQGTWPTAPQTSYQAPWRPSPQYPRAALTASKGSWSAWSPQPSYRQPAWPTIAKGWPKGGGKGKGPLCAGRTWRPV